MTPKSREMKQAFQAVRMADAQLDNVYRAQLALGSAIERFRARHLKAALGMTKPPGSVWTWAQAHAHYQRLLARLRSLALQEKGAARKVAVAVQSLAKVRESAGSRRKR